MICGSCRERRHETCRGGSWCDCQHQRRAGSEGLEARDEGRAVEAQGRPDPMSGESAMNWKRQG